MNPRNTWRWLLSAAVLFASILIHQIYFRKPSVGPEKILPSLQKAMVVRVQVLRPASQLEIWVERTNSGWSLSKPLLYPGRSGSIEALLDKLSTLIPVTTIPAAELKHRPKADEEFGFANPQASILIDQDTNRMQLLVGGMTGPGDQLYVQLVGLEAIHVVNADLLKLIPRAANDWRDTALVKWDTLNFDHVVVTNAGKIYVEFQRDNTNAPWRMFRPLPLRADSAKIDQSLEGLKTLHISQFVTDDPKTDLETLGLQHPEIELTLVHGTNVVAGLQFGKTNTDGKIYARRIGQNTIVTVPKELVMPWRAPVNDFRSQRLFTLTSPIQIIKVQGEDTFSIERQGTDTWMLKPNNFQADPTLVIDLLSVLSGMRVDFFQDVVTESGLPAMNLAPPLRRYVLESAPESGTSSNALVADLHFGARQTNHVLVRRSDETSVYAVRTNDFDRLPSASWQLRERQLWSFNETNIAGAIIRKEGGKMIQIIRKDTYKWTIAPGSQGLIKNELALEESIRGLVQVAAIVWVARGEQNRAKYGIKSDSLQITLELKSKEKVMIEFGGEATPTSVYACATLAGQPLIFEFPWVLFRDLLTSLPVF
jgi:hypothetical protein